jgi:hypothetical protein
MDGISTDHGGSSFVVNGLRLIDSERNVLEGFESQFARKVTRSRVREILRCA